MPEQRIIITTLPKAVDNDFLVVSAHFSPRLYNGTLLGQFNHFASPGDTWPELLKSLDFQVEINNQIFDAELISEPDETLWPRLFNEQTPVIPYGFRDYSDTRLRSFFTGPIYHYLKQLYQWMALDYPNTFPPVRRYRRELNSDARRAAILLDSLVETGRLSDHVFRRELEEILNVYLIQQGKQTLTLQDVQSIASGMGVNPMVVHFYLFQRFYKRPKLDVPSPPAMPELDFHRIWSIVGDYPEMQRRLGMVIDLQIPNPGNLPADGLSNTMMLGETGSTLHSPYTRYILDEGSGLFFARGKQGSDAEVSRGKLRLNDTSRYFPAQVNIDGTIFKALNLTANIWLTSTGDAASSYITSSTESLPALQSAGIGIMKQERAVLLNAVFALAENRNGQVQTNQTDWQFLGLRAEDVTRGYIVDVFDEEQGRWFSLCRRIGRYRFNNDPTTDLLLEDEGFVSVSAVAKNADELEEDLYLHEALFQWDGWSLAAEKPGTTIISEDNIDDIGSEPSPKGDGFERIGRVRHHPPDEFELETWFNPVPGTLPKLRFGRRYRIRVRIVDLAGNAVELDPDSGSIDQAAESIQYSRFEPIASPVVIPTAMITEGESIERMVIRSNYNQTPQEYINDELVEDALSGYDHQYYITSVRHIAPPKVAQFMAEMHGEFDEAIGAGQNIQAWFNIAIKEQGTFRDPVIYDTQTGQKTIQMQGIQLITPPGAPDDENTVTDLNNLQPGDSLGTGQYVIHDTDQLLLPYLPDPIATEAIFHGLPGTNEPFRVSFNLNFPDAQPFRIRIQEGNNPPEFSQQQRVLDVYMPKAEIVEVQLSSPVPEQALELMGIWQWLLESNPGQQQVNNIRELSLAGKHWMMTPHRTLTLVHAVQQPLEEADFNSLNATKHEIGDTYVLLSGQIQFHCKSTGRMDILSDWDEPHDDPSKPLPMDGIDGREIIHKDGRVAEIPIEPFYEEISILNIPVPHQIAGTEAPQWPHTDQHDPEYFRHDFGDTRHRRVRYSLKATTRFRDYLPAEIYENPENISRRGPGFEVNVLSSARPGAPKVLYVLPTFGWEQNEISGGRVSRRCGGGLRIYLDRPWYSSGEGELLGVMVHGTGPGPQIQFGGQTGGIQPQSSPVRLLVTQWGMDPIWEASPPPSQLSTANFPEAVHTQNGVTFEETSGAYGAVAGHEVHFDEERKLWYSDIVVDMDNAYYPFIRLALVRYQPNSIDDAHISRVVLTDFIQPAAERVAAVTRPEPHLVRVSVTGIFGLNQASKSSMAASADHPVDLSRIMAATLEYRSGPDETWQPFSEELTEVKLDAIQQYEARMLWMTTLELPVKEFHDDALTIPQDQPDNDIDWTEGELRVTIKEYEILPEDDPESSSVINPRPGMRVVYADAIWVPEG
jgi:hypothetical protein